jgi:transposase
VFAHGEEDLNSFRYIVSNFIDQGLCKKVEVQRAFHVSDDSIYRYCKLYKEKGADGFFGERPRSKRRSHKMVGETTLKIQKEIDKGRSVNSIAKEFGISEGTIRYQIQQGYLKKRIIKP